MRGLAAFVLILLGALLVPVAVVGHWVNDSLVPTEQFTATAAPLAQDEAVVEAVSDRLTQETVEALGRAGGAPGAEVAIGRVVGAAVASPVFGRVWEESVATAHKEATAVLEGDPDAAVDEAAGTVDIRLGGIAATVRERLVDAGVPLAGRLPDLEASLPLGRIEDLQRAQAGYDAVRTWGPWVAVAAAGLLVLGVLAARNRRRAVIGAALASLTTLALLAAGLFVGREVYLVLLPADVPRSAGRAIYDTMISGLWPLVGWTALAAAVAAVVAVVVGAVARPRRG
jgi:hypothetical protein